MEILRRPNFCWGEARRDWGEYWRLEEIEDCGGLEAWVCMKMVPFCRAQGKEEVDIKFGDFEEDDFFGFLVYGSG